MGLESFRTSDGCRLVYDIAGSGPVVVWQHGLGAPLSQPIAVFPADVAVTRISLGCRGHQQSDLGDPDKLSMATFADDVLALLDHLTIDRVVAIGGISLGAGIALRIAALYPQRTMSLILARPAWVDRPSLETQGLYVRAGEFLQAHGRAGEAMLAADPLFAALLHTSPDNAKSLLGYFHRPRPETTIALLSRLPKDSPGVSMTQIKNIAMKTLVIGNDEDVAHPLTYARELAAAIPEAELSVITSKTVDADRYHAQFEAALAEFLTERLAP
jgi:pimeloyl-ACP methyl ester carboxylesterase